MQIDASDEQYQNAEEPINESREPDSKMIDEREESSWNAFLQSSSREEGIQMDESDLHLEKVSPAMHKS
jgi:hypothetical protein